MKQKSAMQQLIEKLKKISENEKLPAKVAYLVSISQAEQLLELEKQTIVSAYLNGHSDCHMKKEESGTGYFTQTFEQ